jgi:hypothetical protein
MKVDIIGIYAMCPKPTSEVFTSVLKWIFLERVAMNLPSVLLPHPRVELKPGEVPSNAT